MPIRKLLLLSVIGLALMKAATADDIEPLDSDEVLGFELTEEDYQDQAEVRREEDASSELDSDPFDALAGEDSSDSQDSQYAEEPRRFQPVKPGKKSQTQMDAERKAKFERAKAKKAPPQKKPAKPSAKKTEKKKAAKKSVKSSTQAK